MYPPPHVLGHWCIYSITSLESTLQKNFPAEERVDLAVAGRPASPLQSV
jgi:hypothetical protein